MTSKTIRVTKLKMLILELNDDGIRQYQIAGACGIHPSSLSAYCLGTRNITRKHLRALKSYFGLDDEDILGWEEITL